MPDAFEEQQEALDPHRREERDAARLELAGRVRQKGVLIDGSESRAAWIPRSHNHPGFPSGIGGRDLLFRLREQAAQYGVTPTIGLVETIRAMEGGGFELQFGDTQIRARFPTSNCIRRISAAPGAGSAALWRSTTPPTASATRRCRVN